MPLVTLYMKPEYPPLLPLGRRMVSLPELRQICVDPFPASPTREGIMCGLEFLVAALQREGIVGDLWIDGSFLTQKIDADDADIVLCMQSTFTDNMTPSQVQTIDWMKDGNNHLHNAARCHCFAITRWPAGHPDYELGEYNYAYWLNKWGFPRGIDIQDAAKIGLNSDPKGIAVLELR